MTARPNSAPSVAIVGGGVTGLACALALADRGAAVTVFEAGSQAGEGALVKSGGMLAQGFESANEQLGLAFTGLAARALALWPDWADAIETVSGIPIGFRTQGSIVPALTDSDGAWTGEMAAGAARYGIDYDWLTGEELLRREPALSDAARSGLYFPHDGEVDNRALGQALVLAALKAGVRIETGKTIEDLSQLPADIVLVANGHGAPAFQDAVPEAAQISPVKGQMLAFDGSGVRLGQSLRSARIYLSQKPDGRIVAGATSEPGLADTEVESAAMDGLRQAALEMIPALGGAAVIDRWAGIRPASPDGLPLLGQSSRPNTLVALGTFRNGVLLAPAVGEAIARLVFDQDAPDAAFDPQRFARR